MKKEYIKKTNSFVCVVFVFMCVLTFVAGWLDINGCIFRYFDGSIKLLCYISTQTSESINPILNSFPPVGVERSSWHFFVGTDRVLSDDTDTKK